MTETKKILSPSEWIELEVMWGSGEYTLAQLADKSGLRVETLSRRFKSRGVSKGSSSVEKAVREAIKDEVIDKTKQRLDKIEQRRDFYDNSALLLAQVTRKTVTDVLKDRGSLSAVEDELKTLQRASATLAKCFDISAKALGMDREEIGNDELPELMFGELTLEQVQQIRKAQSGEDSFIDAETDALEEEIAASIEKDREELEKEG